MRQKKKNHPSLSTRVFEEASVLTTALAMRENLSWWRAVLPDGWEVVIATVGKDKPDRKLLTATQTTQFLPLRAWNNLKILQ